MTNHIRPLVKRVQYLRHQIRERHAKGFGVATDVLREGDALVWVLSRLLADGEVRDLRDANNIRALQFDWPEMRKEIGR